MADSKRPQDVTPASALHALKEALSKKPPKAKADSDSKKEDRNVFGDAARHEHTKQVVHGIVMILLRIGAFCFYGVLIVRFAHYILPEETPNWWVPRCWLTDEQLQGIDKFFFSGAFGAAIASQLKKNIGAKGGKGDSDED